MQNELKPNRSGNYHHNGNPKHGLYRDNAALFIPQERILHIKPLDTLGKTIFEQNE